MSMISLNGKKLSLEVSPQMPLKELVEFLRKKVTTHQNFVSSIFVNGVELTYSKEEEFASIPFSDFESIEVFTAYSKELIDETLQHLMEYSTFLQKLSKDTGTLIDETDFHPRFQELIDGISTFAEGISSIKDVLHIRNRPKIETPELELLQILRDLCTHYQNNENSQVQEILQSRLPENLNTWQTSGLTDLVHFTSN
jgi:hypothetical protein